MLLGSFRFIAGQFNISIGGLPFDFDMDLLATLFFTLQIVAEIELVNFDDLLEACAKLRLCEVHGELLDAIVRRILNSSCP